MSKIRTLSFRDWPLRWKMMVLLIAASALPLAAAAVVAVRNASVQIQLDAADVLKARAEQLAGELDQFHRVYVTSATRLDEFPEVRGFLLADPDGRDDRRSQLRTVLEIHERTDPNIRGLAVIDTEGRIVMATEPGLANQRISLRSHFQKALTGQLAISDVYLSLPQTGSTPSIAYVAPVMAEGKVVGMVAIEVRAAAFWKAIRDANGRAGEGSYMVLLDRYGIRIGHSARKGLLFKPTERLDDATLEKLVQEERFGERTRAILETPVTAPEEYLRARTSVVSDVFRERSESDGWNLVAERRLRMVPWTVFAFVPETSFLAPIHRLYRETLLACAAILLFALAVGSLLARHIIRPAHLLAQAATRISMGDLAARVPIERGDELGRLAGEFNRMADALERGRENLETEVTDRTQALERARSELEARNAKLAEWSAEIARRQTWDLAFGRTLTALSGDGALEKVLFAALGEASLPVGAQLAICYRLAEGGEMLCIGGTTDPVRIRAIAEAAAGRAQGALASHRTVVLEEPWWAPGDDEASEAEGHGPRCLALVPLVVGERTIGVLVVGGQRFSREALSFLDDLAVPLALTISRHDLGEQTGRFAEELARRNETLRLQAEELASQRDEMRAQHRQLEAKSHEVERANQLKSEFLANMSHELRTPLNAVIGFSELLVDEAGEALTPRQARWVEDILAAGRHLLSLINDILDLAKIEAGRATLTLEPLGAEDAIGDALTLITPAARRKHIHVRPVVRTTRRATADRGKVRQILLNLVSNSVKFCPDRATVEIGAEDHDECLRFWVRDEGPGIDAALREKLFQPFVQGESALVKKHQGTGLGLVISKRLVEQHGGAIRIEGGGGPGVTISFTLPAEGTNAARAVLEGEHPGELATGPLSEQAPVAPAPGPARGAAPVADEGSGTEPRSPAPLAGTPAMPAMATEAERPLILVVEDNPASARLLHETLTAAGYDVAGAETVDEALALTVRLRPAAILLDIILEDEDGLELLRELKRDPTTRDIPVVIQSVLNDPRRALTLGASEYLVKPIQRHTLLERLQGLVQPGPGTPRPSVLVIDDDPTVCDLLASTLEPAGYRVVTCGTGRRGVELALGGRLDLAVVDLMLPDISGFQVIEALAADSRTRGIPIILLTASTLSEHERERLARDVHLLARKGDISMSGLLETVDHATGRARPEAPDDSVPQDVTPDRASSSPPTRVTEARATPASTPATVLVVDDHDLNRELSRALLERLGHRVLLAENGATGVDVALRSRPDLILMDLAMPVKDGFTAAQELKSHPFTAPIPILALTALAMPGDERRALEAGFDGYLTKPIDARDLEKAVTRALGARIGS